MIIYVFKRQRCYLLKDILIEYILLINRMSNRMDWQCAQIDDLKSVPANLCASIGSRQLLLR